MKNLVVSLNEEPLSVDDVLLVPREGKLQSRDQAEVKPFIYSAPMDKVTGYELTEEMVVHGQSAVISRHLPQEELHRCITDFRDDERVFYAIGINGDAKDFLETVSDISERDDWDNDTKINVAIDVAHGDMHAAHRMTSFLRGKPFIGKIMSGSICTANAALRAIEAGCTHLRVGVGPGAACTTRLMTGCGMPQLTAIHWIHDAVKYNCIQPEDFTIIADGGIRHPGDVVKYLAAGADAVMLGSVLSKTIESAGWELIPDPRFMEEVEKAAAAGHALPFPLPDPPMARVKTFRGHASASFQTDHFGMPNDCPEGACTEPFFWDGTTTVSTVVNHYTGGLKAAISLLGLTSSLQLDPHNCAFVRITPATYREGLPHGI